MHNTRMGIECLREGCAGYQARALSERRRQKDCFAAMPGERLGVERLALRRVANRPRRQWCASLG